MSTVSLHDLQHDPAALLDRVEAGEHLVVIRGGRPVAELRPLTAPQPAPRPFGLCAGAFEVPEGFDAPDGFSYRFKSWSDGKARQHIVKIPTRNATLTAPFAIEMFRGLSGSNGTNGVVSCAFELFHLRLNCAANQVKIQLLVVK